VSLGFGGGGNGSPALRLPDLDQFTPYDVALLKEAGRSWLIFASAVSNVGEGPLIVEGSRPDLASNMTVRQVVVAAGGAPRSTRIRATLRYVVSADHEHWHLLRFDRYELRRASDFSLVGPDRKTGFCLGDRQRLDPPLPRTPTLPAFKTRCGLGKPGLYTIREGISVGYADDYKPSLEGQEIDITGLALGRYVLVHRVNADRALLESNYTNNAASILFELRAGSIRILGRCPDTERCGV
jgi:hypothetical protein